MFRYILFAVAFCYVESIIAETVYVKDLLFVPLRGGQSLEHKILHNGVRSGTTLELLEENKDTGYSRIRMENGQEGWMKSQYLTSTPIALHRLDGLQQQISELRRDGESDQQNIAQLETQISLLEQVNEELQSDRSALSSEVDRITKLSEDVIQIDQDNLHLTEQNESLMDELDTLTLINNRLEDDSDRRWFLNGAGVVLSGLLVGFLLGRQIYLRTQSGGWS